MENNKLTAQPKDPITQFYLFSLGYEALAQGTKILGDLLISLFA
jgi:hypothetical protein